MYRVNLLLLKTGTQVHSAVWRVFWAQRQIFKILHVSLSHLSALSRIHMIDSSYFCIEHQHQNTMQAAWHIFIWACEWEICCFSSRGGGRRGGGEEEERRGASGNMSVCVGGRGSIKGEEPCKRYGGCLTLSAPVSTVTVTGAWRWQACREARGPCVVPLCYTIFSLSILPHLAYCPVLLQLLDWYVYWMPQECHWHRTTLQESFQLLL